MRSALAILTIVFGLSSVASAETFHNWKFVGKQKPPALLPIPKKPMGKNGQLTNKAVKAYITNAYNQKQLGTSIKEPAGVAQMKQVKLDGSSLRALMFDSVSGAAYRSADPKSFMVKIRYDESTGFEGGHSIFTDWYQYTVK